MYHYLYTYLPPCRWKCQVQISDESLTQQKKYTERMVVAAQTVITDLLVEVGGIIYSVYYELLHYKTFITG